VAGNFYTTLAQVLPLLLLAFIWDSGFLARLPQQRRLPKKTDPAGVLFWTKPRVRVYTLLVAAIVIVSIAVTIFVLGGLIPDSHALRIALCAGLVLVLVTLATRITVDVLGATTSAAKPPVPSAESSSAPSGEPSSASGVPSTVAETQATVPCPGETGS
jgi:hypothetical protein